MLSKKLNDFKVLRRGLGGALLAGVVLLTGCGRMGPEPEVVDFVDLERYSGLWYEIASNPQFFNLDLIDVTAEYTPLDDGEIGVLNAGTSRRDGEVRTIEGFARVVDPVTNAKLAVRFPSIVGGLFEGEYWVVALEENYEWAVVSDSLQSTLFVLSRAPSMDRKLYEEILAELTGKDIVIDSLRVTGTIDG